jgi:hypothetical protein
MPQGWLEAPAPGVSSPGAARDELGAPRIVTGAEAAEAMGRLGYNVENMTSMLPTMNNIVQSTTSLIDNAYNRQLAYRKSLADLGEVAARTGLYGAQADNIQTESAQRQQLLPLDVQAKNLALKTQQLQLDALVNQQADMGDAADRAKEAISALPAWNDPQYSTKIDDWLDKNAYLLSRPDAVGKQLQTAYGLVDGRVKATTDFQDKLGQAKELNSLQQGGYLQSPIDPDRLAFSGQAEPALVQGRVAKNLDQLQQLIADPRVPQAQRDQLTGLYSYGKTFLDSNTGASDVMANKAHELFNTTGNFNGTTQGLLNGINASLGKETKPAEVEATIPIPGLPNIKPGEAPTMRVRGTPEQVQAAMTPYEQQQQRQMMQTTLDQMRKSGQVPDTPENRADQAAYQRGEFGPPESDAAIRELSQRVNARAAAAAAQAATQSGGQTGGNVAPYQKPPPGVTPTLPVQPNQQPRVPPNRRGMPLSQTETGGDLQPVSYEPGGGARGGSPLIPTSNQDYRAPAESGDVLGINRNVWANVMSEEGPEFGLDPGTNHMSVFGLWKDSPDVEGEAYRVVRQYGPNSPEAFNAVTAAWTNKFLKQSQPWQLDSPGLQELVIADSQHRGGASARDIIDRMGGYQAVNAMPPDEAIAAYSALRRPLWPGNNDRVVRERNWALQNDATLRAQGAGPQVTTASASPAAAPPGQQPTAPATAAAAPQTRTARLTPLTPLRFTPTEREGEVAQYMPRGGAAA